MKKQLLFGLILGSSILTSNAQWIYPNGAYYPGNIGIGLTNYSYSGPSQYGAIEFPRGEILFSNTNTQNQLYLFSNAYEGASGLPLYRNTGVACGMGFDNGSINLYTASSGSAGTLMPMISKLCINNDGNIGVGIFPLGKLHIDAGTNTGINGKVLIRSSSNDHGQLQIMNPTGAESSIAFIGLGTSFGTPPKSSAGNSNIWVVGSNIWGNGGNVFGIGNKNYADQTNGNGQILGITSNGNIGIGIKVPTANLMINAVQGADAHLFIKGTNTQGANIKLQHGNNPSYWNILQGLINADDFVITHGGYASANSAFYISNIGNIGIGLTSPAYKLDVKGTIRSCEVIVNTENGCDFVFKNDYKLMDLKKLEEFVKTNQHLPVIASEKEMVENGVNMKELQMKLLQKMEEMTLYMIEQNKKLEQQNEKIVTIEEHNRLLKQEIELLKTK